MVQYRVREGVVFQQEEDKMFILNQHNAQVLILNPTAVVLWEHCTEGLDSERIPDLLESSFDFTDDETGLEAAVADASRHLELLTKAGFLEHVS